jgi:hypothetical protein
MKLQSLLISGCALCLIGLAACDGRDSVDVEPGRDGPFEPSGDPSSRTGDVRTRADAAFAELAQGRTRFESRIGPQPWPEDLPSDWPRPTKARVVADTKQQHADRLLLVDLPGRPDEALDSYRNVLRGHGYEVVRQRTPRTTHALHVKRGGDKAVLTFFGRRHATRLEILFIGGAAG